MANEEELPSCTPPAPSQLGDTSKSIKRKPVVNAQKEIPRGSPSPHSSPHARWNAPFTVFLDRRMPSYKRYCGLRRRNFLFCLCGIFLALLALIIGLAAGLTHRSSNSFLPLPSDRSSFTGDLTYYGTGLGACGVTSTDADDIVAVSHFLFDHESTGSDPNANPLCGKKIRAERFDGQVNAKRSVDLTVVDRCELVEGNKRTSVLNGSRKLTRKQVPAASQPILMSAQVHSQNLRILAPVGSL